MFFASAPPFNARAIWFRLTPIRRSSSRISVSLSISFVPGAFAFANPAAMNALATPDGLSNLSSIALCSGGNRKANLTFAIQFTPVPKLNERARKAAPPPRRPSPLYRKRLAFCRTCGTSDRRRSSRISPTSPASGSSPFPSDKRKLPCVLNMFSWFGVLS